jgi:hypothetical protein
VEDLHWEWVATINQVDRSGEATWQVWRGRVERGQTNTRMFRSREVHVDIVAATQRMFAAINKVRDQMVGELYQQDPRVAG